jgi:hypothetical protein
MKRFTPTWEIEIMYRHGWSVNEIEEFIERSNQAVYERLKKVGVKIRSISEGIKLAIKRGRWNPTRGSKHHSWSGGRCINKDGYIEIITRQRNKILEHRVIWELHNGKLPEDWVVHHLNGTKADNRLENLAAMPRKKHSPLSIVEPYRARIKELERELYDLKKRF